MASSRGASLASPAACAAVVCARLMTWPRPSAARARGGDLIVADAAHQVRPIAARLQRDGRLAAGIDSVGAAAGKAAAPRLADERGHHAGDGTQGLPAPRPPRHRDAGQQSAACRGAQARRRLRRAVPVSTTSPAYITTTRAAMRATMPRSWVMSTRPMANSRCSSASRCRICAWIVTSSAVVGSSARISDGEHISAMAIITRWRRPPESWWGYWLEAASPRW